MLEVEKNKTQISLYILSRIPRTTEMFVPKSTPAAKQGYCQNQGRGVVKK